MSGVIVIDRIEGNRAVLVMGAETVDVPTSWLPEGASEGSVLSLAIGDDSDIRAAAEARQERLTAASDLPDVIDL